MFRSALFHNEDLSLYLVKSVAIKLLSPRAASALRVSLLSSRQPLSLQSLRHPRARPRRVPLDQSDLQARRPDRLL